ncbi:MAG: hypothetical protein NVS4B8_11520 [Herpetosiphon sp.]
MDDTKRGQINEPDKYTLSDSDDQACFDPTPMGQTAVEVYTGVGCLEFRAGNIYPFRLGQVIGSKCYTARN